MQVVSPDNLGFEDHSFLFIALKNIVSDGYSHRAFSSSCAWPCWCPGRQLGSAMGIVDRLRSVPSSSLSTFKFSKRSVGMLLRGLTGSCVTGQPERRGVVPDALASPTGQPFGGSWPDEQSCPSLLPAKNIWLTCKEAFGVLQALWSQVLLWNGMQSGVYSSEAG